MNHRSLVVRRRGFAATESVVVLPILLFLIIGTVVGGYGVFRYQQIALLAREGARYASVHGGQYQQETGNPATATQDVYTNVIAPMATNLDLSQLTPNLIWGNSSNNYSNMPSTMNDANGNSADYEKPTGNYVTVTIRYNWLPEMYLVGPIVLTSTSVMPISY